MLTVATWNLENFGRPSAVAGAPSSQNAYNAKVGHLKDTITAIGADVIGVQEVLDPDALEDLRAALGAGWHAISSTFPDDPHHPIRVGFLSKLPFTAHEDVVDFPAILHPIQQNDTDQPGVSRMGRGALHVTVEHGGIDVHIIACHLKSKLLSFPNHNSFVPTDEDQRARYGAYALYRRAAEVTTVRCYVDALLDGHGQDRALVVLGDMNDEAAAATTQMLLGPPGSQIGTGGFDHPDGGDGMRLWNLAPLIPEGEGWSRTFEGKHELIDHLLASRKLVGPGKLPGVRVYHQGATSIGVDPSAQQDKPASDHDPVYAHFDI